MVSSSTPIPAFRVVRDVPGAGVPSLVHPGWSRDFPWLVQGTTTRGADGDTPFDLGLFAPRSDPRSAGPRWDFIARTFEARCVVHAHQRLAGDHQRGWQFLPRSFLNGVDPEELLNPQNRGAAMAAHRRLVDVHRHDVHRWTVVPPLPAVAFEKAIDDVLARSG